MTLVELNLSDALKIAINLHKNGKLDAAKKIYLKILSVQPKNFDALHLLGLIELSNGAPFEAIKFIEKAININGSDATVFYNLGNAYRAIRDNKKAIENYNLAINLRGNFVDALHNRGATLSDLKLHYASIKSYNEALKITPLDSMVIYNRANAYKSIAKLDLALRDYSAAFAINKDFDFLFGRIQSIKMQMCDWSEYDTSLKYIEDSIIANKKIITPFSLLMMSDFPELHKKVAQIWLNSLFQNPILSNRKTTKKEGPIHIGYFSADFHDHATAHLTAQIFELHDRSNFRITAFSFGPRLHDSMRLRLINAFDNFLEVGNMSDSDIASLSNKLEVDIAVDLKGFTSDCRPGIFMRKAAPIQINYLGYPGTWGSSVMNYIIADKVVITCDSSTECIEKIIYLPKCYQPVDAKRLVSKERMTRSQLNLPESGFVFCCFNNNAKITPHMYRNWMSILSAVKDGYLWLYRSNQFAEFNLKKEAKKCGVDPSRIIFAEHMPSSQHLARYKFADLFLDTFPYNAHTTASDALMMGLPVLTKFGKSFPSRVAASILNDYGMEELVVTSDIDYIAAAVNIASNKEILNGIKQKLQAKQEYFQYMGSEVHVKYLEDAYKQVYEHRQNLN